MCGLTRCSVTCSEVHSSVLPHQMPCLALLSLTCRTSPPSCSGHDGALRQDVPERAWPVCIVGPPVATGWVEYADHPQTGQTVHKDIADSSACGCAGLRCTFPCWAAACRKAAEMKSEITAANLIQPMIQP